MHAVVLRGRFRQAQAQLGEAVAAHLSYRAHKKNAME